MSTPIYEGPEPSYGSERGRLEHGRSSTEETMVGEKPPDEERGRLKVDPSLNPHDTVQPSPSRTREEAHRLDDDLAMLQVERQVSITETEVEKAGRTGSIHRSRTRRSEPVDEFDAATNPLHEQTAFKPPENPTTSLARFVKKVHNSSFLIRYFTYITPLVLILLIPLLVGALAFPDADVGGVRLMWFSVWLEIFWLTLWAGRIVAKCIPVPVGIIASMFTNNAKKWRDLAKQLELPAALFFWWLAVEISFLPTMKNHHVDGNKATKHWELVMNKIIISIFVGTTLNLIEKLIIQLIAISFHLRTYADRIEINKFQIGSLTKLYDYSKKMITMEDREFEDQPKDGQSSGARTPMMYADRATRVAREALHRVGDVAGVVAGDFTGRKVTKSSHPYQVVLTLLGTTAGSQVLARRLYRTFVREGFETVFSGDLKAAFDNDDEAEAAFNMFDKDMNGDISMEELEAVCVEIGRERKSITASLKDLDSVVSKLDDVFLFIVVVITILVFLSLISTSAAGVLASAGSTLLALSWLFSATAQEFLQSIIFVFVKHPFDVGDRVSVYGNTGANLTGDDYFVKEIALLYTEFKKMEGHVVQAPNSYLNTLFILNQRRSGGLAEAVPIVIKFGTSLEQIDALRQRLLDFVLSEKREYQGKILTELRQVTENYSITLNVVFFYKSNWQNELLRLQRRNKFICNLMISLQEVGIEGPRMNLLGYKNNLPYHVSYQGAPPQYTPNENDPSHPPPSDPQQIAEARDTLGELGGGVSTGVNHHPSILRRPGARGRGNSASKHVDFSLGMSALSSGDLMSDVYSDREKGRVDDVIRSANRETAERRLQAQQERLSLEREASHRGRNSLESYRSGSSRQATSALGSTSSVHRNRFFGRLGSRAGSHQPSHRGSRGDDDMMEQGRYVGGSPILPPVPQNTMDSRTRNISSQAAHDDYLDQRTTNSDSELMHSRSMDRMNEEFEMGRLGHRS
ncbi:conserved hypothetical protein [Uncinocarpus reesii 1704]|uniref:EF-hand domain-containing protein n=1 Tax=Uncinocarpus reesii (strain UAMH 1704) TaxID=336963 RepID=C4JHH6_UNCRE|nr:uncharacterized protein UREG_01339 [Uncinocarpus reesii 1704]EEP76490.1 conserved hypothetical protein [Uncinocarpus reesii 1704]